MLLSFIVISVDVMSSPHKESPLIGMDLLVILVMLGSYAMTIEVEEGSLLTRCDNARGTSRRKCDGMGLREHQSSDKDCVLCLTWPPC